MKHGIREIKIRRRPDQSVKHVRITFGPHHFIELTSDNELNVEFVVGATHHGIRADASKVDSELFRMTEHLRQQFSNNLFD